jgi:hypothetical protein
MAIIDIDFAWPVAENGYRVRDYGPPSNEPTILTAPRHGVWLEPVGANRRLQEPLAFHPALFLDFAGLPETPAACCEFASSFGLLLGLRDLAGEGEAVETWFHHIRRFRHLVELWRSVTPSHLRWQSEDLLPATIAGRLVWCDQGPVFSLQPNTLLSALRAQFYTAVAELKEITACEQCGRWFERGPGKPRRGKSRFCSDRCRSDYHNLRKRKGAAP